MQDGRRICMTFNSYIYMLCFLPVTLVGYFAAARIAKAKAAQIFLFIMSMAFIFYGMNWKGTIVLLISITVNYSAFRIIKSSPAHKKKVTGAAVAFNALALFAFKYAIFGAELANQYLHMEIDTAKLFLPIGISFYTFQQISFLVDACRGEVERCTLLEYLCYVTYFPQFLSGPIVFQNEFLPQLRDEKRLHFNWENFSRGMYRFAMGLAKKVIIADTLIKAVDFIYADAAQYHNFALAIGVVFYSLQLYFDFSGYCDMAIGTANMMNFDLPENFNSPYKAMNIADFWNRWHISLTRFLTKYVYIPLGGNRKGKVRTYVNIMIVYLVSGIWHGSVVIEAFVVWGLMHGIASVIYKLFHRWIDKLHPAFNWLLTFAYVNLAWVPFRVLNMDVTKTVWANLFKMSSLESVSPEVASCFKLGEISFIEKLTGFAPLADDLWVFPVAFLGLLMLLILNAPNSRELTEKFKPTVGRAVFTFVVLAWCILYFSNVGVFIYAGF